MRERREKKVIVKGIREKEGWKGRERKILQRNKIKSNNGGDKREKK